MWVVTYTITPDRGYFDKGEQVLWESDIYFETIQTMEFLEDGSIVVVYEVDGDVETLCEVLDAADEKVIDYATSNGENLLVLQLWFYPDEALKNVLSAQRSFGVSVEYPTEYVSHDPTTVELTETGPRDVIRERIQRTREVADVSIKQINRYDPSSGLLFQELTERQQEVLHVATELGYYKLPRETTHEEIADELGCSRSVVGQHLRRIEATVMSELVPELSETRPEAI